MEMPLIHKDTNSFLSKHLVPLCTTFLAFFIFTLFFFKWLNNFRYSSKNPPPSPPGLPLIGNFHQFFNSITHRSFKSLADKYGPVMTMKLGSKPIIIISSADAAEEVLRKNDLVFVDRAKQSFIGRIFDKDMVFAPYGDHWRQIRFICASQLLSKKRVQSFRSVLEQEIKNMLEKIRESCFPGSAIAMSEMLATLTTNAVSLAAIGRKYSEEPNGNKLTALFKECTMIGGYINLADCIPWFGWIYRFSDMDAKVSRVAKEVDEYMENVFDRGIKKQEKIEKGEESHEEGHHNFLDVLIGFYRKNTTGTRIDRDSVKGVIMNMVVAGPDTTYSLLEWAMAELLRNPSFMTKLQNEVREIRVCEPNQMITEDHLGRLPYLKAVIKETLRMHPSLPLIPRLSRESVKIMGYDIEAGTPVYINVWAIGRDPQSWNDPDEFRPERFIDNPIDLKGQHFQYIPFGAGRRMCPGIEFALATAELTLANLMRAFNFSLANELQPEELDMKEAGGMVVPRENPLLLIPNLPN
ncbi:OLC1v1025446C1 [Oldenlandia corymbosa var. corymbosa]|uniref:OLC1v1025446C1 n=1 Tax=Oldenlandia corymbosa var. corymbosa TaxID=529605 RepID=A0AAV1C838_OLDCO|nr:OLC1v1025446C1 [Oldenlandia corymbosa var. corymbosa]